MAGLQLSQFRDASLIGQGSGADVYRAVRVSTGGEVAVKAFLHTLDPATVRRRVDREVGALVALKGHPHIIQVEEVLQVDDSIFVVMELAPGGSLHDRIKAETRLSAHDAATIGVQIGGALAAAHDKGILHRDVKPQNILFGAYGTAKLCDFGMAAAVAAEASRTSAVSIRYASPEELDGAELTSATDVYSLGATLLHAVVGRPADLGERLAGIESLVADVPPPLRDVIVGAMSLAPSARPTAAEMRDMLGGPPGDRPAADPAPDTAAARTATPQASLGGPLAAVGGGAVSAPAAPAGGGGAGGGFAPPTRSDDAFHSAVGGSTVGVIFDRPAEDPPPPAPRAPWHKRPLTYVLLAALAIGAAVAALVLAGNDDAGETADTSAPPTAAPSTVPAGTAAPDTTAAAAPTTAAPEPTAAPAATNPYGDVIGQPVDGSSGPAARFAVALQQRAPAAAVASNLSAAYYYALAHELTGRVADATLLPLATETGYAIATAAGAVVISDVQLDATGLVVDAVETRPDGATAALSAVVQVTGVCVPGPESTVCDFTRPDGVPEALGTPDRAWVLARLIADPTRVTHFLLVTPSTEASVVGAFQEGLEIPMEAGSTIIALDVPPADQPNTFVRLTVLLSDGRALLFDVPVSAP